MTAGDVIWKWKKYEMTIGHPWSGAQCWILPHEKRSASALKYTGGAR